MSSLRDFSTISPSAKALLLTKAQTTLPFARQAAERLFGVDAVQAAEKETAATPGAAARCKHFELRARSLDEALHELGATRVLEIAGGLSMRGLAMAAAQDVFYLDTDLPGIAALKADLIAHLHPAPLAGTLRVEALDALDAGAFDTAVSSIPGGSLAIVHEGLLMYLDDAEKARLSASVRAALLARGGWWVTADVYVRSDAPTLRDERTRKFLEVHQVEERKFASFEAAEAFFTGQGFDIARRAPPPADPWPTRQTWALTPR
jgi:O-methyltransferase involved in polyketide biosynthesis